MYIAYSDMEAFFGNYHHIAKVLDSSSQDTKRACLLSIALEGRVLMVQAVLFYDYIENS